MKFLYAGYLNNAASDAVPEVSLALSNGMAPGDLQRTLSDMHSKGTTYSCAVAAGYLEDVLRDELPLLETLFLMERDTFGGRHVTNLVNALLTAGAKIATQIPDFNTLVPPLQKE